MQQAMKSVTDYLESIVWDGTPRIDRWLVDCAGADDTSRVRAISRAMLVAAVRRARHPGCRFDQMPVIEGQQGCGKSSALRVLAIDDAWFTDELPLSSEDTRRIIEATEGKWIVEVSELESLLRDDAADDEDDEAEDEEGDSLPSATALKSFLSRSHDEARMAYQRDRTRVPRQFVVIGTTSDTTYLQDTGNRRFWPVSVRRFDLDRLISVRNQLWAEAAYVEAAGELIGLDAEEEI